MQKSSLFLITLPVIGFLLAVVFAPLAHSDSPAKTNAPAVSPTPVATTNAAPSHGLTISMSDDEDDTDSDKKDGKGNVHAPRDPWDDIAEVFIPTVAILATFGTPILIVFFVCYFKYRRRQEQLITVRQYLDKGIPVPAELLADSSFSGVDVAALRAGREKNDMRRGFKLAFIGLGLALAFFFNDPHSTTWCWGLIPAVMGVGYILSALFERRNRPGANDLPPGPDSPPRV